MYTFVFRNVRNDRATSADIASYYQHYVNTMGLSNNLVHGTTVTSMQRASLSSGHSGWHIRGTQRSENGDMPFFVQAENVVLATGTNDAPARLGVEGESLPFVCHSFGQFEEMISSGGLSRSSQPVLVVGAGLTAADAVLCTHHLSVPVYHAFRRSVLDPALIFNQLPRLLYPEYHKVHQMMSQQQYQPSHSVPILLSPNMASPDNDHTPLSCSYPGYLSFPKHRVVCFKPNGKCVLEAEGGHHVVLQVSLALVLIGSQPNLSFLPEKGEQLGLKPGQPISCRHNPIKVEQYTYKSVQELGLYALGPLVGENFVRFLKGGALGVACHLMQKRREKASRL